MRLMVAADHPKLSYPLLDLPLLGSETEAEEAHLDFDARSYVSDKHAPWVAVKWQLRPHLVLVLYATDIITNDILYGVGHRTSFYVLASVLASVQHYIVILYYR